MSESYDLGGVSLTVMYCVVTKRHKFSALFSLGGSRSSDIKMSYPCCTCGNTAEICQAVKLC